MTTAPAKSSVAGRLSVQRWLYLVVASMVLLVIAGTIVGARLIAQTTRDTRELIDRLQPAATEAYRLQAAIIDQESGIRGYALVGDSQLLEPYTQGKQEETRSTARLRELLAGQPALLADLDAVERTAARWRAGYADPLTADRDAVRADAASGKEIFDGLRAEFDRQNGDLHATVEHNRTHLSRIIEVRNTVLAAMVGVFLLTGLAWTALIRRLIVWPLREQAAISARQAAELDEQAVELRRSNAELEQFAYVASHDLQEPLRKVASFCQLLEKRYGDLIDDRGRQYIAFAVDGAQRMQLLINDLLAFSRVGRVSDRRIGVDLGQSLDKALDNLDAAIEESGARVRRPERLPEVTGDPMLLTMLWQNLIGNAIKFRHPDRPPVIEIDCRPGDSGEWELAVTDNGIGIPAEFEEKVFVIFQRLHGRDEYSGTGIGLALCKKIVEQHGGRIWLDTAHTEGARLCFTLPLTDGPGTETATPATEIDQGAAL